MLNSSDTALLRTQAKLLNTARDRKGQLEIFNGLPHAEDLKGDPILCRDGSNSNVGSVLTPHNVSLMEAVELRNNECRVLLLLRGTVLGAESIIRPYMSLCLRRRTSLLTIVLGEKLGVHVTEEQKRGR
jgi:hypothetical protein